MGRGVPSDYQSVLLLALLGPPQATETLHGERWASGGTLGRGMSSLNVEEGGVGDDGGRIPALQSRPRDVLVLSNESRMCERVSPNEQGTGPREPDSPQGEHRSRRAGQSE